MVDGAALMLTPFYAARASGFWGERGTNHARHRRAVLRGVRDRRRQWLAVGAIEPQFYAALLERLGLDAELDAQSTARPRPVAEQRNALADGVPHPDAGRVVRAVRRHRRVRRAGAHAARGAGASAQPARGGRSSSRDGVPQPAPAPRFCRTTRAEPPRRRAIPGHDTEAVARRGWGFSADEVADLRATGAVP